MTEKPKRIVITRPMKPRVDPDPKSTVHSSQSLLSAKQDGRARLLRPTQAKRQTSDGMARKRGHSASDEVVGRERRTVEAVEDLAPAFDTRAPKHHATKLSSRDAASGKKAYEVGYKKPPLQTRWTPGHCPNPKGRPRGSKDTATLVTTALDARVAVTQGGRRRMITKRELAIIKVVNLMTEKGNINSLLKLTAIELTAKANQSLDSRLEAHSAASAEELSQSDRDILRWYLDRAGGAPLKSDNETDAER